MKFILGFIFFLLLGILACEAQKVVDSSSEANSPPVITSVNIFPEKPNKDSELGFFIEGHDPDRDPVQYDCQWIRNGEELIGENKNVLKSEKFRKGDLLRVRVTPSDGKVKGLPFLSDPVKILNSPPVIQEVWIEPKMAQGADRLKASVKSSDPDGDSIDYSYQWEKNGEVLNEERGEFLERGRFKKGDSMTVTLIPDDGETQGSPKKSETLIISNDPPLIVSSPPTSAQRTKYFYQVKTNHADGDPLTFTLKSRPRGMEIDGKTGLIQWEIRRGDKGRHAVEVEVSDDAGTKCVQRYTLAVDFR